MNSVIGTATPGIGVTASAVRSTPCTTHGWRPTSVTVHPASVAMKPNGVTIASARRSLRFARMSRRRSNTMSDHAATMAMSVPSATMI